MGQQPSRRGRRRRGMLRARLLERTWCSSLVLFSCGACNLGGRLLPPPPFCGTLLARRQALWPFGARCWRSRCSLAVFPPCGVRRRSFLLLARRLYFVSPPADFLWHAAAPPSAPRAPVEAPRACHRRVGGGGMSMGGGRGYMGPQAPPTLLSVLQYFPCAGFFILFFFGGRVYIFCFPRRVPRFSFR